YDFVDQLVYVVLPLHVLLALGIDAHEHQVTHGALLPAWFLSLVECESAVSTRRAARSFRSGARADVRRFSSHRGPQDPELLHPKLQGRAVHAQPRRRSPWA